MRYPFVVIATALMVVMAVSGVCAGNGAGMGESYAFSVFVAEQDETLEAITFHTAAQDARYTVKVFDRMHDGKLSHVLHVQRGQVLVAGTQHVNLSQAIHIAQGDDYYLYVQLDDAGPNDAPIAIAPTGAMPMYDDGIDSLKYVHKLETDLPGALPLSTGSGAASDDEDAPMLSESLGDEPQTTPEPASLLLLGGLSMMLVARRLPNRQHTHQA